MFHFPVLMRAAGTPDPLPTAPVHVRVRIPGGPGRPPVVEFYTGPLMALPVPAGTVYSTDQIFSKIYSGGALNAFAGGAGSCASPSNTEQVLNCVFSGTALYVNLSGTVSATQLQGRGVAASAPSNNQVLTWVAANSDWEPQNGGGGGSPGGSNGQIQYNSSSSFAGFTLAGDCTISVPNITCTKTNGISFAAVATTGSATDLGSGTLPAARLPNPSASALGGVKSITSSSHNWIGYIDTSGVPHQSQPAFSDISGTLSASQCPTPSTSTIGCIESLAAVSHNWINSISTSGVPSATQPACGDLSNAAASCSTDATNATNISSGTLGAGRLPNPSASTLGGIESFAAQTNKWINAISTSGVPSAAQPSLDQIGGAAAAVTFSNGTNPLTINQTSAANETFANTIPAVHGTPQYSPILNLNGNDYSGSASELNSWTLQNQPSSTDNTAGTLVLNYAAGGVTGAPNVQIKNAALEVNTTSNDCGSASPCIELPEGATLPTPLSAKDFLTADQTSHRIQESHNGSTLAAVVTTGDSNTGAAGMTLDMHSATSANALLVPNIAGAAPTTKGAVAYDTTNNTPVFGETLGGSSSTATLTASRTYSFASVSLPSAVSESTVGTTETSINAGNELSFPANYFTAGKAVIAHYAIQEVTAATVHSFTYNVRVGSSCCAGTQIFIGPTSSPTPSSTRSYSVGILIRCLTTGSSGTFVVVPIGYGNGANTTTIVGEFMVNRVSQPVTASTSAAETLYLTITFGNTGQANTTQELTHWVEELN